MSDAIVAGETGRKTRTGVECDTTGFVVVCARRDDVHAHVYHGPDSCMVEQGNCLLSMGLDEMNESE